MKSNLKRFLSLMLAFLMVLSNVPVQAFATEGEVSDVHVHNYTSVTTDATCDAAGEITYTCTAEGCDNPTYTEPIAALGHSYVDGVCSACGGADPDYVAPETPGEEPVNAASDEGEEDTTSAPDYSNVVATYTVTLDPKGSNYAAVTIDYYCGTGCNHDPADNTPMTLQSDGTWTAQLPVWCEGVYHVQFYGDEEIITLSDGELVAAMEGADLHCEVYVEGSTGSEGGDDSTGSEGGEEDDGTTAAIPGTLYFVKPAEWGDGVNAYFFDANFNCVGAQWPGTAMTKGEDGVYSIATPDGAVNCVFNDGTNQTPDLTIPTDGSNQYSDGAWSVYTPEDTQTATEIDLSQGSYTITEAGDYIVLPYEGANTLTIQADANVTLKNVKIDAAEGVSAISIESGDVTLSTYGASYVTGGKGGAGIYVAEGAELTIGESDSLLEAIGNGGEDTSDSGAAGIGGTYANGNSGAITIDGAAVSAKGYGVHGSGIGSGSGKVVGEIVIKNGANVYAQGGYYADGAGTKLPEGDKYGSGLPEGGAAIGGGGKTVSTIANITIADSKVTAYGGSKAAGIGANFWSSASLIDIDDSTVTAYGGVSSAAIGTSRAGDNGVSAKIEITDSKVNATGGDHGAGIGGGYNGDSLTDLPTTTITIDGTSDVTATGANGGAGIGGGYKTNNLEITISGTAKVTASASVLDDGSSKTIDQTASCAIGSGANGSGTFNGATVTFADTTTIEVTAEYGGKPAIEGYTNDAADALENVTVTVNNAPVASIGDTGYTSIAAAVAAAEAGATITVNADHEITDPVVIEKNVTIDLTGVEITGKDVYPVIRVQGGATVTVKGGTITNDDYVFVLGASDGSSAGSLTIESGKYHGDTTVASVTKGTLTILDGEFSVDPYNGSYDFLLNCIDANYADGTAKIVVKGGSFANFNPADNKAESGGADFTAPGYVASEENGVYTVAEWNGEIYTKEDLMYFNAAANAGNTFSGKTVKLMADIDFEWGEWKPVTFAGTFEGNENTIKNLTYVTTSATGTQMGFFNSLNGTAKNFTIDGAKATLVEGGKLGGVARLLNGTAENVHIKNLTVEAPGKIDWFIGGFAGFAYGYATNCSVENFTVNAPAATGGPCIGGFIGSVRNNHTYTNCDVKNFKVTAHCTDGLGLAGFTPHTQTGWQHCKFIDCDVTGIDFTVSGTADVAGFITWPGSHTTATNCTTEGKIDVTDVTAGDYVGGFYGNCGWNADLGQKGHLLTNCSADVDIITKVAPAGGFVGSATVQGNGSKYFECFNCSASGDITAVEGGTADIGGFAGDSDRGVYNNCSASGTVTNNGTGYAGQFVGAIYDVTPSYDHRYPAGTRDYLADEITLEDCTYTGASTELKFIGNTAESADVTIVNYVAQVGEEKYTSLAEAVAAANAVEGGATVTLLKDVTLGEKLTISGNVTIEGEYTITRDDAYTGTLFTVNSGAALTLDGGVVIDGANNYVFDKASYMADAENRVQIAKEDSAKWFTPEEGAPVASAFMFTTTGGTINLNKVTIQNNYSVGSGVISGGAGSTINLTGAKITHVASTNGNGVVANVSGANINVTVNEGTVIDGNHVGGNHGLFKIYSGARVTMNGGEITNNTGWNSNGVVAGLWGSSTENGGSAFIMNGGLICSNVGVYGPNNGRNAAIYGHTQHVFIMNGGTICHNSGAYGGLDAPYSNGTTKITGGAIVNNESYTNNPYYDINGNSAMVITGGTFTQDVSAWLAPDTGLVYDEETGSYGVTTDLAEVNGIAYKSVAEAVAAANVGDTVKVLSSHKPGDTIVIDKNITLDLNGKTLLGYSTVNPIVRVLADVTVTGNGMIDSANQGEGYCFIVGSNDCSGNLTIENGTFKGTTSAVSVTKGKLTILGGDFRVKPYKEVTGKDDAGNDITTDNYNFLLNCIDANYRDGSAVIEVKGGTFTKFNPAANAAEGADTNFVAEGYTSETADEGATYTVRALNYVAQVGETKYESLKEALEACTNGETVKLIANITYGADDVVYAHGGATGFGNYDQYNPSVIYLGGTKGATAAENQPSNVKAVLDLNGHTITSDADAYLFLIMDNAKVTFKDSVGGGAVVNNSGNYPAIWSVGAETLVTIESGKYQTASPYGLLHVTHSGDMVITGGDFSTTADDASLLVMLNTQNYNNPNYFLKGVATISISGGTFHGFNPEKVGDDYGASSIEDIKFVDGCATGYEAVDNGNGTFGVEPWNMEIWNVKDLMIFNEMANAGNNFSGKTVKLMADVDLEGMAWTPIKSFAGEFDGNGDRENGDGSYTISNFHIEAVNARGGFFNVIEAGSGERVHDLTLSDVTATVGNNRFGTLANSVQGIVNRVTVKNVTVTTTHTNAWVGGMCAFMSWPWMNDCTVENLTVNAEAGADLIGGFACILQKNSNMVFDNNDVKGFKVTVTDTDASGCGVGGFVAQTQRGWEYPKIINTDVTGIDITASGLVDVGGFIVWPGAHTTAENCTTEGKIDVTGVTSDGCFAGGFFGNLGWNADLGQMGHKVTDCSADVDIITKVAPAGGFVGSATNSNNSSMYATFTDCFASGDITCVAEGTAPIGGFAGNADRGVYNNCSATGTVTNNGTGATGGFIGEVLDTAPKYDGRYPAGTRDYLADVMTFDTCTGSAEPFIGKVAATKPANELNTINSYVAQVGVSYYATFDAALAAAKASDGKMTLLAPVVITADTTLDLTGVTITGDVYPAFRIQNGAKVTVKGGAITNGDYIFVLGASDGSSAGYLTIESGKFHGETTVASVTKGELTINGGEFSVDPYEGSYDFLLNCIDANYRDGSAKITVTGGTFYKFDPAANAAEGAGTSFLAEGYVSTQKTTDYYTVSEALVEMDGVGYASIKDALWTLRSADTTVHTVKVLKDHEIDVNYSTYNYPILVNGFAIELDLNGKTITADWSKYEGNRKDNALIGVANGGKLTVTDSVGGGKIVNNDNRDDVENRIFWIMTSTATKSIEVTIKGGTFVQNETNTALLYVQGNKPSDNLAPIYVNIIGGHFETVNDDFFNAYDGFQHESYITGGTFNKNPSDWEIKIHPDYKAVENEDGIWGIVPRVYVAQIGENKYETLTDAIEAAEAGNKIIFLDNIEEDVTVTKAVTIDGGNFRYTGKMTLNNVDVTIENVNFVKGSIYKNKSTGVGANITIKGCPFDGQGLNDYAVNLGGTGTITIEVVTAKNYGYGFLQVPATNNRVSVKDVIISDVNYGFKIDYSNGVALENVKVTAAVAGILNSNYGEKTITIKNSELSILGTWKRNDTTKTTYIFEGANTVGEFVAEAALDIFKLATVESTLTAPADQTVTTDVADHKVVYENGVYKVVAKVYVAQIGETKYESLAEAVAAVQNGETITLLTKLDEDVTIKQTKDLSFTIDGAGNTYTGTIKVNGNKRNTGAETLTIQNVNFVADTASQIFIEAVSGTYAHNITVDKCTFTGDENRTAFGLKLPHSYNIAVKNSTGTKLLELAYSNKAVTGFTAEDVIVTDSVNGFYMSYMMNGSFTDLNLDVSNIGVYTNNYNASSMTIADSTIKAATPVALQQKNATKKYELTFNGTNSFTGTSETGEWLIVEGKDASFKVTVNDAALNKTETMAKTAGLVARIGENGNVYYNRVNGAIADAKADDTIYVIANVTEDTTFDKNIVLEVGEHKLLGKITVAEGAELTIMSGTFNDMDAKQYIHEKMYGKDNGDGTWTVVDYVEWIKAELLAGNNVTLEKNIVIDGSYIDSIPAPTNGNGKFPNYGIFNVVGDEVTFDLNGHTITYNGHADFEWNNKVRNSCTVAHGIFFANAGANLTIVDGVGTGKVLVHGMASGAYVASPNTKLTIKGGTWKNDGCETCGGTNIFMYPLQGGELYIEDGYFEQALDANGDSYLLVEHGGEYKNDVIDYAKTKLVISGGTFVGMNPEEAHYFQQTADNKLVMGEKKNVVAEGSYAASVTGTNNVWTIEAAVAINVNTGKGYGDVTDALMAAGDGHTVKLLKDAKDDFAMVTNNVTFDLNGHTLEVMYMAAFTGTNVVDNSTGKTGLLKVAKTNLTVASANAQMPIWNGTDGYVFAAVKHQIQNNAQANAGKFDLQFRPSLAPFHYALFADGMADNGLKVVLRLTWTDADTGNSRVQDFVYSEDLVSDVYKNRKTFTFYASGLSEYPDMIAQVMVVSDLKVESISTAYALVN